MRSPIDFTLLWDRTAGFAVHCSSIAEAEQFVESAKEMYPEMCQQWSSGETNYNQHKSETIYTFDTKSQGVWKKLKLMYGGVKQARDIGYTIVEFSEIYQEADINESEAPISALFG